ncbi:protein of unknown function [Micromonospora rhizosphaerae]|uniref:DUF4180 domain-containing protein n=1 Tax=Micromonospora rhizosphaerae TaxID=568872 RepID=A0A1C6RV44_9ACTN|nr:DUF4180 domain-containing protein [Micromonospora rhizosphaerae]SCL21101.1 protein of unknown function [Micromonospora rhizosphaerae]
MTTETRHGIPVYACPAEGAPLRDGADALEVVGAALGAGAELVVLPVERLTGDFFRLRSGVAGEIAQKFVNYRLRLAVVGDIAGHLADSAPLRDFVRESNRGRQLWFLASPAELDERLRKTV